MKLVRVFLFAFALSLFGGLTHSPGDSIAAPAAVFAAAQPENMPPPKVPDIDVHIDGGGKGDRTTVWYLSPTALAAGAVVLIVFIALIAMASRGGGTTIIREK
jgi:hypothetical protein